MSNVLMTAYPKARKSHKCCECGCTIEKGETYCYTSGVWDGEPDRFKQCKGCDSIMRAAVSYFNFPEIDDNPQFTRLADFIFDSCDTDCPEDIAAIANDFNVNIESLVRLLKIEVAAHE